MLFYKVFLFLSFFFLLIAEVKFFFFFLYIDLMDSKFAKLSC